ncbi:sugar transferase [candidate division KSB1 bacterium]|nr:sugar transferase [candidate division KSB1 bacterium]
MDDVHTLDLAAESSLMQEVKHLFVSIRKKVLILIDLLFLNGSFWLMHLLSGEHSGWIAYIKLCLVINVIWLYQLIQYRRFRHIRLEPLFITFKKASLNAAYLLFAAAVLSVFLRLSSFSHYHVFGTFILYFLLEAVLFVMIKGISLQSLKKLFFPIKKQRAPRESLLVLVVDLVLLFVAFFSMHYLKYGTFNPDERARQALLVVSAAWLITAKWTGKFHQSSEPNVTYAQSPYIKACYISIAIMSVIVFALGLFQHSRVLVFGSFLTLLALELPFVSLRARLRRQTMDDDIENVEQVKSYIKQHELPIDPGDEAVTVPADAMLRDHYLTDYAGLYHYLQDYIPFAKMDKSRVRVLNTHTFYNIKTLEQQQLNLFINLHYINNMRWLNKYFLEVHSKLRNGGYFVLRTRRLENYRDSLERKYPRAVATFIYIIHFILHRVIPKISGLSKVYFTLLRGRNRVITRAEIIGRLHFCGFRFMNFERIGDSHWFVARKVRMPAVDRNPTYGPLIRLRRIGYAGKVIYLHKFRTMHPYAEYLQDFVYETNQLDASGKFKDDFRLTQWGKIMRKYWLDELPQFINYIRGDIRLFGVRALSQHYFKLYPQDVQELRTQFKPGLVPPFYADMPKNFDEIVDSERRYLLAKKNSPLRTDLVYFFRALRNILLRRAHSR